jgi:hypothetical protein
MGRLIDADKLIAKIEDIYDGYMLSEDGGVVPKDFVEFLEEAPTVEAIPKADYENRLKADMVAMLEDLKQDLLAEAYGIEMDCTDYVVNVADIDKVIQQKINELKGDKNGSMGSL